MPLIDAPSPRLPCVSYAPFRDAQSPFDETLVIRRGQIEDDLGILAGLTGCVRIYSVDQGLAQVPAIAERLGLEVLLGAWLGRDPERNAKEIASVIELANRHPETIRGVVVGNEVLLRGEMPPDRLIEQIRSVAAAVEAPVTYADVWEFWLRHPEVAGAVDLLTIHVLPYWEDQPVAVGAAVGHVGEVVSRMRLAVPGKPILIGEVGWPSRGRMRERALPSPVNQARFVREMLVMAEREDLAVNLMEGIDQPWKRRLEGTVGGFWGVLDAERRAKFPLTGPVSAEPQWLPLAAASAGLALLPMLWIACRRMRLRRRVWLTLALAAPAAACAWVLAAAGVPATSVGLFDWSIGIARLVIAAASLALTAHVLLAGSGMRPAPPFDLVERIRAGRLRGMGNLGDALGWLRLLTLFGIAATTLCLAFDGRYRDFAV
ncbi:MAG: glycoside hydrolase family 17 protein, partial [Rhodospirillales bacterium]